MTDKRGECNDPCLARPSASGQGNTSNQFCDRWKAAKWNNMHRSGSRCSGEGPQSAGDWTRTGHAIKPRLAARGKVNSRPSSPVMLRVCLQGRENSACRPNFIKGHPGLGETRVNNDITLINTARDKGLKENIAMAANLKNIHLTIVPLRSGLHALITRPFRSRDVCPATPGTHAGPLYM